MTVALLCDNKGSSAVCQQKFRTALTLNYLYGLNSFNPIVVGLFDSTILVGGGATKPPLPNSLLVIGRATKFGVLKASGMYFL